MLSWYTHHVRPLLVGLFVAAAIAARVLLGSEADVFAFVLLLGAVSWYGFFMLRRLVQGRFGVDVIALLAMGGALLMREWWAGIVVLVMLTGGEWLEDHAFHRAQAELKALFSQAPRVAQVRVGGELKEIPVERLVPGQSIIIKPGDMVPVDVLVVSGRSSIDVSRLTGEPLPVDVEQHDRVLAGSINQGGLLEGRILTQAKNTQYYRMRALVEEAQAHKAPLVRLADRWSGWFTLITLIAALVAWMVSGDPVRALAVLVVATPCPLLLATPIAFLSGMSAAFKQGVIVKHGGALEILARLRTVVFDKTGTLTLGTPHIRRVMGYGIKDQEVLRLAASLDQGSGHVLARALTAYAKTKRVILTFPTTFQEVVGKGVIGEVKGEIYILGRLSFLQDKQVVIPEHIHQTHEANQYRGERTVYLARGNWLIGAISFADVLRPGLRQLLAGLRREGVERITLLTGDRRGPAQLLARTLGIKDVQAECLPSDKLEVIRKQQKQAPPVAMVGDGINDAPALAQADVGIAVGIHEGVSSEAADVVLVTDDPGRLSDLIQIAQRTLRIARSGIFLGMGLSGCLMVLAILGLIPPFLGAWLQEAIDITVIIYALQAKRLA